MPTPYPGDLGAVGTVLDVACSWTAISNAVKSLTADQVTAGVIIRVAPGALIGNGAGASNTPVLTNLGSSTWTKRVTICPRDGYGTVTMDNVRFNRLIKIALVGFDIQTNNFTACNDSALAWSFISGGFSAFYSDDNLTSSGFEIVEVVFGTDAVTSTSDRCDFYVGGTGAILKDYKIDGCYFAPKFRKDGVTPAPHVDTVQWGLGSGGAAYPTGFYFRDTVIFASQTTAFQRCDYVTFEKVMAVGGAPARSRYPYTAGSDSSGGNYLFNGWGYYNKAIDCVFIGQHKFTNDDAPHWSIVTNTSISSNFGGSKPQSGAWTLDSTLNSLTDATLPPLPNEAYRREIWNWLRSTAPSNLSISVQVR